MPRVPTHLVLLVNPNVPHGWDSVAGGTQFGPGWTQSAPGDGPERPWEMDPTCSGMDLTCHRR